MKLIVGLGNPGKEYEATRHNVGYAVVDKLAKDHEENWKKEITRHALTTKIMGDWGLMILAKPTTYMNLSGRAVTALIKFYKIKPEDVLIVQDDLDLKPGAFGFTSGGSAAGHHGIESIQENLPDLKFARLRVGIGKPMTRTDSKDWVLSKPKGQEKSALDSAIKDAATAALDWAVSGVADAMNRWNSHNKILP